MLQTGKMAAVGQLAAGVAHELNNPIVGILGYAQYALEKIRGKDPSQLEAKDLENYIKYVGYIEQESQRCKVIIQNLLNFSRKGPVEMAPTDVNKVLESTFTFTTHQLQINNVRLNPQLAPGLPPIMGNAAQLQQVFTNLIINAQKAMDKGGVITVSSRLCGDPGDENAAVEASFTDTGCGIAPEHLAKIFDPFFMTRKVGEGTGLGLSLSHGIVKNHGGEIAVESTLGKGTTFTISLPLKCEVKAQPTEPEPAHSLAVGQVR
jgi:signal transduction histidine kinase